MNKAHVKQLLLADKIYIKKTDVEDDDLLISLYTYNNGDEFLSTIEETEDHYIVPSNSYYKLTWDSVVDNRNFEPTDADLTFIGTLRAEQQEVVDKFFEKGRARSGILQAPCGWGKCKPYNSQILTDKGYLSLSELRNDWENTCIINHKGTFPIINFFDNGVKRCYEVRTQLGNRVRATENHPLLTWNQELLSLEYKTISQLTTEDVLVGKYNTNMFGARTIEDSYLIGLLIGDGGLTVKNLISFSTGDKELETYFVDKFKDKYSVRVVEKQNHKEFFIRDKALYQDLVLRFNIGCKSVEKPICRELRELNRENTILLLRGLFDTDGCANKDGTVEFCSSSRELAYYVFEQLLNLGILARIREKKTKAHNTFIVDINSKHACLRFFNIIGFTIKRKQDIKSIWDNKKYGSTTTGNFPGLNKKVYELYHKTLLGKGYSDFFYNYSNNNISVYKFTEALQIFLDNDVEVTSDLLDLENCYATKVVEILDIGDQQTYDIELRDASHSYVSEGIINHNTFTGCEIISRNKTKTLVLVHTKLLFRQWIEELERQIPTAKIGKIGDGILDVQDITVGIYKSVFNNREALKDSFSMVIVDEAHLCPAEMFSTALNSLNAKIKIGISATPKRKDGKHVYLADYFSQFFVQAKDPRQLANPSVKIIKTDFSFPVIDPQRDWSRQINKLTANKLYLELIANTAINHIAKGRCPLILGDRIQMLKDLQALIPESVCLIGESDEATREDVLNNVGGKYKAVLSTKLFDEGISCHRLDTLYITCPNNNPIKLEQRVGRIIREHPKKQLPLVVDFWLTGGIVSRQQQKRLEWYKLRGYNIL
jgi:superfamily II DNA or RNA helicase